VIGDLYPAQAIPLGSCDLEQAWGTPSASGTLVIGDCWSISEMSSEMSD
jgi:hypothetical protein